MGKASNIKENVGHMVVNFGHPFGVVIKIVYLPYSLCFGGESCVKITVVLAVSSSSPVLTSEIELLGSFHDVVSSHLRHLIRHLRFYNVKWPSRLFGRTYLFALRWNRFMPDQDILASFYQRGSLQIKTTAFRLEEYASDH